MFNFQPEQKTKEDVPFYDDVTSSGGWEGHATSKSVEKLQQEIAANLALIGCVLTGYQSGKFGNRFGYQIHFAMKSTDGQMVPSRLDIACLPINPKKYWSRRRSRGRSEDPRIEGTKKMALFMTAKAIKGMYFLNMLSPAFVPFMSLMLTAKDQTLGQLWIQQGGLAPLLPPPTSKFEGEVVDGEVQ